MFIILFSMHIGCNSNEQIYPSITTSDPLEKRPQIGDVAPNLTWAINGESASLNTFKGNPIVIIFWSITCPTCQDDMAFLEKVKKGNTNLEILAINVKDSGSEVAVKEKARGVYSFKILLDYKERVAQKCYQPPTLGLPHVIFIGSNGIIQDVFSGPFKDKEQEILKIINSL
jgi:thiol-disulfide isomerase/thioredoxin